MRSFKEIKAHYRFTADDEERLVSLGQLLLDHTDRVIDALHGWIIQTPEAAQFFPEETKRNHILNLQKNWFQDLFSGSYTSLYHERIIRIGQAHRRVAVDSHFMTRAMNIIRNVCIDIVNTHIEDAEERTRSLISLGKILDINLDIMMSSYIEEELKSYSPAYRVKYAVINFAEIFSKMMNVVLVLCLIGLTLGVVGLFVFDSYKLFTGGMEYGIITSLGSLLMLWVVIELMNTEIRHLKGGKFFISVFIGVALVSTIREAMIAMLKHEKPEVIYYLIAGILALGIVYWLVKRTEEKGP